MVTTQEVSTSLHFDSAQNGSISSGVTTIGHIISDNERSSVALIGRIENGIITDVYATVAEYSDMVVVKPIRSDAFSEMIQRDQVFLHPGFSSMEQGVSISPSFAENQQNIEFLPLKIAVSAASGSFSGLIHSEQTWHVIQSVGSELIAHGLSDFTSGERDRLTVGNLVNINHDLDSVSLLDTLADSRTIISGFREREYLKQNHLTLDDNEIPRNAFHELDDLDLEIYKGGY